MRSASVRGAGRRRDRAVTAVHEASGAMVFVLARGPGQHATRACRSALEQLLSLLSRGGQLMDFDRVAHQRAVDGHATTLIAGVVQPEPGGPRLQACRVGDFGAWLLDRATGSYHPLFAAEQTSDDDMVDQVVEHLTDSEVLLVGTAGFGGEAGARFARHLAVPPTPTHLARVLVWSRRPSDDDDRTLVAVWPADR